MLNWLETKVIQGGLLFMVILFSPVILYAIIETEIKYRKDKSA